MITIVIPFLNEADSLEELFVQICKELVGEEFEVLFVDDGSKDQSLQILKKLAMTDKRIRFLSFSRNFGHQAALRAGIENATGDACISMDADLQHPPHILPLLIKKWKSGIEIVYTIRQEAHETSLFKKHTSRLFYYLASKISGIQLSPGTADFRLVDKKVLKILNNLHESNLFYRGIIPWVGFKQEAITFKADQRSFGKSKYTLSKMTKLALIGLSFHSVRPLYMTIGMGTIMCLASFVYACYALFYHIFMHATVSGWTSLVLLQTFIGGVQLIILGVVGHYIGLIAENIKGRPDYIISEKNF